jgi:serine/threonine-protein kinase
VKPENVLVTPEGHVKVADFGLARAFAESRVSQAPGTVTGTVQYLAPEQIQGEPADPRTDLYATGIVAYELLTGHVPFTGETSLAIAYRHLSDPVPRPSESEPNVPLALDRIVAAATEKDRDRRPDSAADMRESLLAVRDSLAPATSLAELVRALPAEVRQDEDRAFTVTIPQRMSPKARRRRILRRSAIALMALVLLVAGALAAWAYVIPHYTNVPKVLGMSQDDARSALVHAGLDPQFGPPQSSTTIPAGEVLRQSVDPGARVEKGTDVTLRLSAGLPLRTVPAVTGKTLEEAQTDLQGEGLKVQVRHAYSDTVRRDLVLDQNPLPQQQIPYGSSVTITVSEGRQPVQVPNVVGQSSTDAQSVLASKQLNTKLSQAYSTQVPVGDVVSQDPVSGKTVPINSTVKLVISLGPQTFPMPAVSGLPASAAQTQLEGLGLQVHVVRIPNATGDTVVGQVPARDTTVERGETVTIYVA